MACLTLEGVYAQEVLLNEKVSIPEMKLLVSNAQEVLLNEKGVYPWNEAACTEVLLNEKAAIPWGGSGAHLGQPGGFGVLVCWADSCGCLGQADLFLGRGLGVWVASKSHAACSMCLGDNSCCAWIPIY